VIFLHFICWQSAIFLLLVCFTYCVYHTRSPPHWHHPIPSYSIFAADTLRDLVTLTFDLLTFNSLHTWQVTRGQPRWCSHQVWISCVYSFLSYELLAEAPSALGTLGASARFMIQDFQQSTMAAARRWEGSAFTNALEAGSETAGKTHRCRFCSKLCGVGPACQHTHHTHTHRPCWVAQVAGRQPAVDRSLCHHDYRIFPQRADSCLVVWDIKAVVAAMPTPWNPGVHAYTHAHPQERPPPEMCGRQTRPPADVDPHEI